MATLTRRYVKTTTAFAHSIIGKKARQVLWGDWLDVEDHPTKSDHYIVHWRRKGKNGQPDVVQYEIEKKYTQAEPILEMIFLDVGQGDGCIVALPGSNGPEVMIIDAGVGDNMQRFLDWRFSAFPDATAFKAAIITHPDKDHYNGFKQIFEDERFSFENVYHNGLIERASDDDDWNLGKRTGMVCEEVFETAQQARTLLADKDNRKTMLYPNLLWKALSTPDRFGNVAMLGTDGAASKKHVPGYATGNVKIEIVAPILKRNGGKASLPAFGDTVSSYSPDKGKTKNGNSVVLRLQYGNLKVIFGGDLNKPAENHLLRHYGGISASQPLADAVAQAKQNLAADVLKCCHHGSADVTDEFVQAVNPFAFVVSSGDEESHVHPRPEVLGMLGKHGRSMRPLVLCTEILRSTPESAELNTAEKATLKELKTKFKDATTPAQKKKADAAIDDFYAAKLRRVVNVYGAINVRSDGNKLVIGFLKEKPSPGNKRWHTYSFEFENGDWKFKAEDKGTT